MKLHNIIIPTILLSTTLFSTGCSSNKEYTIASASETSISTEKDTYSYSDNTLVKAFFNIKTDLRLPIEDLCNIIRSFDNDNSFIEADSSSENNPNQTVKSFTTKDNKLKLTIKYSFSEIEQESTADSVQLAFLDENIALNLNICGEQINYTVEKNYSNPTEQHSIDKSLLNNKSIENHYFSISNLLNSGKELSLEDVIKTTKLDFSENMSDYNDPNEDIKVYSYFEEDDYIILETTNNKVTSIMCSSSIINENNTLESEVFFMYNLNNQNKPEIQTILTFLNLDDMLKAAATI